MPSLVHLSRLTRRLAEIPYQNVTKILARERGDLTISLFESPLSSGAGGTCFAVTRYAYELLSAAGFEAYPVMADRSYGHNTHCALIVAVEGKKYLVDPGFLVPMPVPLDDGCIFTGFNFFKLILSPSPPPSPPAGRAGPQRGEGEVGEYQAWTCHRGTWKYRYRFSDRPVSWDEFSAHWRSSFNWSSMNSVVITAVRDSRQIYLHDRHLRIIERDRVIRSTITPIDLSGVSKLFGIGESLIQDAFEVTGSFNHDRAVGRVHRSLVESTVEEEGCS